jgi:hypothetical protein
MKESLSLDPSINELGETWLEFRAWAWLRITGSGNFDQERCERRYKIACEEHEKRVKKLQELEEERSRVQKEMMSRGASIEELDAYEDSVYPEIHMYLMASRSLY